MITDLRNLRIVISTLTKAASSEKELEVFKDPALLLKAELELKHLDRDMEIFKRVCRSILDSQDADWQSEPVYDDDKWVLEECEISGSDLKAVVNMAGEDYAQKLYME